MERSCNYLFFENDMSEDSRGQVAIIIPALNEEEALQCLLREIPQGVARWTIVVDNGSTDRTAQVARAAGAIVVSEPQRGYGKACYKGLMTAEELGADFLIFMDGDGSDDPADLPMMIEQVRRGAADLVIGSRVTERAEPGAVLPQARLGNWLVSHMIHLFYGVPIHDIGSYRAIRRTALMDLHMQEMTYGWPVEMLVKAARAHYRVIELPIHYRRRSHGQSKVSGTLMGSVKAAYYMLSITLRYAGAQGRFGYAGAQGRQGYAGAQRQHV
jgi:glycosyltransferase involved in cell wall biosynthesis